MLFLIAYNNLEIVSETSLRNLRLPRNILEGLRPINKKAESVSDHLDWVLGPRPSILEGLRNCKRLLRNCSGIGIAMDCLGIA